MSSQGIKGFDYKMDGMGLPDPMSGSSGSQGDSSGRSSPAGKIKYQRLKSGVIEAEVEQGNYVFVKTKRNLGRLV